MFRIHKGNAYSGQEQHRLLSLNFYHLRGKSELLSRFTAWLPQAAALVFQSVKLRNNYNLNILRGRI